MEQGKKHGKNTALRLFILTVTPILLIQLMNNLIPFDELQMNVAIGFGIVAGAIGLAAAIAYIKFVHWSCAGLWTIGLMLSEDTLPMFLLAAVWTVFAGAAVGMTIHCFKELTENESSSQRRAALSTALRGLALFSFPISFLVSFETSMSASLAFLLVALLPALIGLSYRLNRQEIRLRLMDVKEAYSASAFLALISLFNIARLYLETSASPLIAKIMLWAALLAAFIAQAVAFHRMRTREMRAAQTPTGA